MISLDNVSKRFGRITAVDSLSLGVKTGEIFGLVGPDGAGKTTIIRMIIGILTPDSGAVSVLGEHVLEKIKGNIGYVPQKFSLYGELTVMENISLLGALYGADKADIDKIAEEILTLTKLKPFKDRLADNLSGGMKQKLALAAGLVHKPKILFLDEPTTGVDPVSRREFWQMLYGLNKEGMTIVVSTPYMDEAELCSRIAFMHDGRVIACDTPKALCAAYPHKLIELKTSVKRLKPILKDCAIMDISSFGDSYHLVVSDANKALREIKAALGQAGITDATLKPISPSLEDVFVALAGEEV
ncbi:MAG: ABC transporter ATP-binding protein [Veillonellaceae bacterium]|nr:ABC transporter ATP-binding protein [Veillonellaceae bacterium]